MHYTTHLDASEQKQIKRLARRAAAIEIKINDIISQVITRNSLKIPAQDEIPPASEIFTSVLEWCKTHQTQFMGKETEAGDHIIGRWRDGDTEIAIFPAILENLIKDLGARPQTVIKEWSAMGLLSHGGSETRCKKTVRLSSDSVARVYALKIPLQDNLNSNKIIA